MKIIAVTRGLISLITAAIISVRKSPIKLKTREIGVVIRILIAIGQIFSLIVPGVVDRNKRCENFFPRVFID